MPNTNQNTNDIETLSSDQLARITGGLPVPPPRPPHIDWKDIYGRVRGAVNPR